MYLGEARIDVVSQNVNAVLGPALLGKDVTDQQGIDDLMIQLDGTHNKVSYTSLNFTDLRCSCAYPLVCSGNVIERICARRASWEPMLY